MTEGVQVTPEALKEKYESIANIDTILDAQSGSKAAGKRSQRNALVTEADSSTVDTVISQVSSIEDERTRFGTFFAIVKNLEDSFSKAADELVEQMVAEAQADVSEKLSDEQISEMEENRKKMVTEYKALRNILEMFGQDVSEIPEPKVRRGSRGPRGPRTLSKFQYTVNETELESDVNSLSTVAKLCTVKVKELKQYITDQGIDLKNPPSEWTASLPNGVGTLTAVVLPEFEADFDEDDESDEDE